jgi:hypothetical protein
MKKASSQCFDLSMDSSGYPLVILVWVIRREVNLINCAALKNGDNHSRGAVHQEGCWRPLFGTLKYFFPFAISKRMPFLKSLCKL